MDPALFDKFVKETAKRITRLRSEAAHHRSQRNEARAQADALRAELAARGECRECHCQVAADVATLAKGECPRSGAPKGTCGYSDCICYQHRA